MKKREKVKKGLPVPNVYVLMLFVVLLCGILTYIVPAGEYSRVEGSGGQEVVDPDSFHYREQSPVGVMGLLESVPQGLVESAGMIFLIFILGGAFQVVQETGAIHTGIALLTNKLGKKEFIVIPVMMFLFSLGGALYGMAEETLPFIPIMILLATSVGYDSLVGTAIVLAGSTAGFAAAFLNPFTVGIAQGIAGLPLLSGMGLRVILYICMVTMAICYVLRYALKVKKNPEISTVRGIDRNRTDKLDMDESKKLTRGQILVLLTFAGTIGVLIFGVFRYGWYLQEISALFFGMSVLSALFTKMSPNQYGENLAKGMMGIAGGALAVGFARAILVVLEQGGIMDTILFGIAKGVAWLPGQISAMGMYLFQCLLNYVIPSGSAQAAVSMPIMAPLSDLVGVTRQTSVLAFQLGDGISNIFTPTSGLLMAGLALGKIPWNKWARFIGPLILLEYLLGAVFIIIAQAVHYGPF